MAGKRPVLCPICGAQIRKTGYCSGCYMPLYSVKKAINTSNYYYNVGYDKAAARDLSGAVESLTTSLRYNKKNVQSRNLLGLIYYEMGEIVNALSQWIMSVNYQSSNNIATRYLKELRQDPTRLDSVNQIAKKYNMALGYANSRDYDLAIMQLKACLSDNPHFVKGYVLLALLYMEADNYEKARKSLKRALKIDKANPVAIHYLHEMGDTDENIIQLQNEEIVEDDIIEEDFTSEVNINLDGKTEIDKSVKNNIFREFKAKKKDNTIKLGEFGEVGFAKYSGIYMLLGIIVGIMLFYFVVIPRERKKLRAENDTLIESYCEELANKEAELSKVSGELAAIQDQIAEEERKAEVSNHPMPDYSQIQNGMSDEDIMRMISNE